MTEGDQFEFPYSDEVSVIVFDKLDCEAVVNQIVDCGVSWTYSDDVRPADFRLRICLGVGYYTLLDQVGADLLKLTLECGLETSDKKTLRLATEAKQTALLRGLPSIVGVMHSQAEILEVVEGVTGKPPNWGNVIRWAAGQNELN